MAGCPSGPGLEPNQSVILTARRCFAVARALVPPCEHWNRTRYLSDSVIEECNNALWCVGLQILQDPRDVLGEGQHRCVVAVQLFDVLLKHSSLFDGRMGKSSLKRLTVVVDPDECPFRVGDLAEYIGWLSVDEGVELRFINGVYRLNAGESLLLTLLEHWAKRLTVLHLTGLAVEAVVAETIVDALLKNISVTDLAVGFHIFASGAECRSSEHFCQAYDIGLCGCVLVSNNRVLDVRCRPCCDQGAHQPQLRDMEVSLMESWVSGLKKNHTLRRLAIDLSLCTIKECCLFVGALADSSVEIVTVRNVADDGCIQALYATIRHHDLQRRVIFEDHHVDPVDAKVLRSYPESSVVTISSSHFLDMSSLCGAIGELALCRHITSLRLRFDRYDEALYNAAAYVMTVVASTVRDMELYAKDVYEEDEGCFACQNRLIEAVASNRNLTRLKMHVDYLNNTCIEFITVCVLESLMLSELSLEALNSSSCGIFLRMLLPRLTHNYRLLEVTLPDYGVHLEVDMARLRNITRRNRGLIDVASRLMMRDCGDPYGVNALQLVAEHPKLAETVARKAEVTEAVARSMIEETLQLIVPSLIE
ncbi:hypothetical protein MTO96_037898 [Rhipicephalus appendiculatus]